LTFNEKIKANISADELANFEKVAEVINNMISNKQIYNNKEHILKKDE